MRCGVAHCRSRIVRSTRCAETLGLDVSVSQGFPGYVFTESALPRATARMILYSSRAW